MDETYIRVGGKWCYLYRVITAGGQTLDLYLSPKRTVAAAKRFLAKPLRSNASAGFPRVINTDKVPSLATDSPLSTSVTEAERKRQLEREVSRLREERDILPLRPLNIFPTRDELVIRFRFACDTRETYRS